MQLNKMITIKEALTKKEMKDYVMFSFELYKNNPNWIPPIIAEELETFGYDFTSQDCVQVIIPRNADGSLDSDSSFIGEINGDVVE